MIPAVASICWFLGLGAASAILAVASLQSGWGAPRLMLVCLGLVGAALGAELTEVSTLYRHHDVVTVAGWVAVGAGLLLVVVPVGLLRARPLAAAALAALPATLGVVAYAAVGSLAVRVSPALIEQHTEWGDIVTLRSLVVYGGVIGAQGALAAADLLLLWQVVEGARATRDAGRAGGNLLHGLPMVLAILFVVKLGWLILGNAGWLPAILRHQEEAFASSRADGLLGRYGWKRRSAR